MTWKNLVRIPNSHLQGKERKNPTQQFNKFFGDSSLVDKINNLNRASAVQAFSEKWETNMDEILGINFSEKIWMNMSRKILKYSTYRFCTLGLDFYKSDSALNSNNSGTYPWFSQIRKIALKIML